ncbi:hypothetical protein DRW03_29015 [Corallococcus sp. H22C18031201]|uniref:hypothetical protein n=1 Tax=Citreicoccus inhibens TaxID=2849499 RepID=UPI000E70FEEB|nr:hypothetical protein [Citreicoccus inhibens]MBU8899410.1 hypothetical protein [Citreicoccus inhibens]RJS17104.1 hypothetical protein DRW03_29015 [Corallococcus sp. H22C18031201]
MTTSEKTVEQAEKNGVAHNVEGFLKEQLAQAQKRLEGLEGEASKVMKTLESRGQEAAKEVQQLWTKLQAGELLTDPRVQELGKKVDAAGSELRKRLDTLQTRVVEAVGVASQSQVQSLNQELSKLSKKLDMLLKPSRRVNGAKVSGNSASAPRA